jgi:Sulfatase
VTAAPRSARLREPAIRGAQLLAASGFAVAQPLLDLLSKNAEFFVVHGSTAREIVLFGLAVTFLPALALLAVELVVGAVHAGAGLALHLVFVGAFAALFAIQALERLGLETTVVLIGAAVVAGVAAALAARRLRFFRALLTVLAPAPLLFLGLFLFASPVRALVLPADIDLPAGDLDADTPVVVVVFDELPVVSLMDADGAIDAGRFPNFARLADDSTWFRNTTTVSPWTTLAVPALLTGNRPDKDALPVYQTHPENLFTLLGNGYRMNVAESQTRLCPPELCRGTRRGADASLFSDARVVYLHLVAPPGLEDRLPAIDEGWGDFGGDEPGEEAEGPNFDARTFYVGRIRDYRRFVGSIRADPEGEEPTLHFAHVLMPHGPWTYFPSGRVSAVARPSAPGRTGEVWRDDALALQANQRHLLQLGFTDRLLGDLIERLEEEDLYHRALIVVIADHGVSFRGGDRRREATRTNLADLAFVPFFVKVPGADGATVVDRHVQTLDVLPTIAGALGVSIPWRLQGRSALGTGRDVDEVRIDGVTVPLDEALAARADALIRHVRVFGTGDWEIYGAGPYGGLVGRFVDELPLRDPVEGEAVVDPTGSRLLRSLPSGSPRVPSPLVGTLTGIRPGAWLAVAVNGEVAATARAYDLGDGVRFSALAAEQAFRPGPNDVRLYLIEGPAGGAVLRELETRLS